MLSAAEPRADLRVLDSRNLGIEEDGHFLSWEEFGSRNCGKMEAEVMQ